MTRDEIIASLEDQAKDKEPFIDHDDPEDIFAEDVTALREAAELLKRFTQAGVLGCGFCLGSKLIIGEGEDDKLMLDHCGIDGVALLDCRDVGKPVEAIFRFKFCPMCGRPLTEEAWAELERRIGGVIDGA